MRWLDRLKRLGRENACVQKGKNAAIVLLVVSWPPKLMNLEPGTNVNAPKMSGSGHARILLNKLNGNWSGRADALRRVVIDSASAISVLLLFRVRVRVYLRR